MTDIAVTSSRAAQFGATVLRFRWPIIAATIVAVVALAAGGQNLRITNDNRVFFSKDNPQLLALEALENTFTETNNLLIAVAPKSGDVFNRETLATIEAITEQT